MFGFGGAAENVAENSRLRLQPMEDTTATQDGRSRRPWRTVTVAHLPATTNDPASMGGGHRLAGKGTCGLPRHVERPEHEGYYA